MGQFFSTVTSPFGFMHERIFEGGALNIVLICLAFLVTILTAYLLGSINFAIIISKVKYKEDIRTFGSKNAGMTNMMRTYGKSAAAFTITGDILKAVIACIIGYLLIGQLGAFSAGLFCMVGHVFPMYYGFKGGKGVVTAFTTACMTDPPAFLIIFVLFIVMVLIWRYISLGSITCFGLYPLVLAFTSRIAHAINPELPEVSPFIIFAVLMSALIIAKHWTNIQRLRNGTESKFTFKKSVKPPKNTDGSK